jgi:hypothetical protein
MANDIGVFGPRLEITKTPAVGQVPIGNGAGFDLSIMSSADVTFLQAGTGAVTRTVQSKERDIVSVKDFGAVGDGATNSSTAFQNALNATRSSNYDTIIVPAGSYSVPTAPTIGTQNPLWMLSGSVGDVSTTLPGATFSSLKGTVVTVPNGASGDGWRFEVIKDSSPLNYAADTRAAMIVQQRDTQTLAAQQTVPGAVFQFASTANGVVNSGSELSESIWWGMLSTMTKTGDGSGHSFTATGQLGAVGVGGYNELGGFQGELTNTGSTKGTMSGVEMLLKDSPDAGVTSYDTKMFGVIGRIAKYNASSRLAIAFYGSNEGTQALDALLSTNRTVSVTNNKWKVGINLQGATFTTGYSLSQPNNVNIGWEDAGGTLRPIIGVNNSNITYIRPGSNAAYTSMQNFSGSEMVRVDSSSVWLYVGGTLKQVGEGAANSGGAGYKTLIVVN